jgi:virulence factor Mce-like protein
MRARRQPLLAVLDNPILVGMVTILVVIVAVYLSYIAENGLPFIPTYDIRVQVANAGELVKNAAVRIGGAQVGQVLSITPEPPNGRWPQPYAQLELELNKSLEPLPMDTHYTVRLQSVLGGQYLELYPGHDRHAFLPDGATFTIARRAALNHYIPYVDLSTAFQTFGPATRKGIRSAANQLGDAVAGRGADFNDAIFSTAHLLGPLEKVLRLVADPATNLTGFLSGAAQTTSALAGVAPALSSLLSGGASTLQALHESRLGAAIDATPSTESLARGVLESARPVLSDAAAVVQGLRVPAGLIPGTAQRLDTVLHLALPVFRQLPPLAGGLRAALAQTRLLADDPATTEVFKLLGTNDLGSTGASAFLGLGAILTAVAPAQFACNVAGLWLRNFSQSLTGGDSAASWLRFMPLVDVGQLLQTAAPSNQLHLNYYPVEDQSQCQSGNEGYTSGQLIGNPPATSRTVDDTAPPPGVLARGRRAGLVP